MKPDVIIVGGGVIGSACAHFLSRAKVKVLVLEQKHIASGSSGAAAALISEASSSVTPGPLRDFACQSRRMVRTLEGELETSIEVMADGSLAVALTEEEAETLRNRFESMSRFEQGCSLLTGSEARTLEPYLSPGAQAAILNPNNYHVNPFRLCQGYIRSALRRGARLLCGTTVRGFKVTGGHIDRIVTDRGDFQAGRVVVAGGVRTPEILSGLGVAVPVEPVRGQVIITDAAPAVIRHFLFFFGHHYIKQTAAGNFYLGSHLERVGFDTRVTIEKLRAYAQTFAGALPVLSGLRIIHAFAGLRPMSADGLPIIGPLPGIPHLIVATGHCADGIRDSAATGKAVSELIVSGKTEMPLDAFRVERFQRG
ncbi:MAG: FAD-dependent oxidoreductase [Desulfobacteraceae bacterium]|nr:MAG: FAD-dependent oxidoreductase [Desulfobacteraceae bacterium]